MKKIVTALLSAVLCLTAVAGVSGCGKELIGFDVELARAVGEKLGIEVEFQTIDWDTKENELAGGTIDAVWNGLTISEPRKEFFGFSVPYMDNNQVAVIRIADSEKYTDIQSIAAGKLGAERGSAGADVANTTFSESNFTGLDAQVDALTELRSGTIDVGIMDSVLAEYYTSDMSNYSKELMMVKDLIFTSEKYGIGFRKADQALINKVNEALLALDEEGKVAEIAEKYKLTNLVNIGTPEPVSASDDSWTKIQEKGKLVIGITIFAPIAYYA